MLAPRLIGVLVAGLTDYYTYRLACRVFGDGAGATAVGPRSFHRTQTDPGSSSYLSRHYITLIYFQEPYQRPPRLC
jgi:hypothetical protein